ncbi:MAG: hypothetical protein ACOVSR_14680 [Bacteroidia bacterium]
MKNTKPLTILLFAILLINGCSKDGCPDSTPIEKGVDKSYLPYIIPYSDTSTRLFLKNGIDTLVFKSQGLKETITNERAGEGSCDQYNLQKYSLKMAASDTDFFQINYYTIKNGVSRVNFLINGVRETKEYAYSSFSDYYPPIINVNILNNKYDTVMVLPEQRIREFIIKPKLGILKIKLDDNTYELIK